MLIRSGGSWSGRERDVCFRNAGDGTFVDTSYVTGLDSAGDGRGFVALDIDGDGALDIVEASRTAPRVRVLRNQAPEGPVLVVELRGARMPDSIGASALLTTSRGRKLLRHVDAGSGYLTQSSRRLHFALDNGETPVSLEVRWPGGASQSLTDVPARGFVRLNEGEREFVPIVAPSALPRVKQPNEKAAPVWLTEPVPAPVLSGMRLRPQKTLVNFWASWCPPCREEMKEWAASSSRFAQAGVRVVVVSADEDRAQRPEAPFAVVLPTADELAAWNLFHRHLFDYRRDLALPTSFLLDERGRVVKVYHGVTSAATIAADAAVPVGARASLPFAGRWLGERPKRNYVELATALAEGGLAKESARYFELALALGTPSREARTNYAGVLIESGDLAKAESLLTGQSDPDTLANLGLLRLRQARYRDAAAAFEKVLAASPDDAMALHGLGSALFGAQDIAGARARFAQAVAADPEHAGYRYSWASAMAAGGELAAALGEFERVREMQGDSAALCNNLGILYVETGAPAKGEAEFRKAIQIAPRDAAGYVNLASLFIKGGKNAEARIVLGEFLKVVPGNPEVLRMLQAVR